MTDIFSYLSFRSYPGRGILLGTAADGGLVCAYFIMGRSENSRNRIFERTADGIRTRAFDEGKMTDPSLIIYTALRRRGQTCIVANGDQTDSIYDALERGGTVYDALAARSFEPDAPSFTPRISGVAAAGGYQLSILKTADGVSCQRFFYNYGAVPGLGHFISTYEGFGTPLPSFSGEPVAVSIPELSAGELAEALWEALNEENRVALFVERDGRQAMINRNGDRT